MKRSIMCGTISKLTICISDPEGESASRILTN